MLESEEMIIPGEEDYHGSSPQDFSNVLDGKNVGRIGKFLAGTEHQLHGNPGGPDETGVTVEELTLHNYNGANAAVDDTSNNPDPMLHMQNQWRHLYMLPGGSGSGSSPADALNRKSGPTILDEWVDGDHSSFSELLAQNPTIPESNETIDQMTGDSLSPNGIRTKIVSKSGFSEFFVKNTLKGKGVTYKYPASNGAGLEYGSQNNTKSIGITQSAPDALRSSSPNGGVSLREWLKAGHCKVPKSERLYIFKQILSFVDSLHSQGIPCQDLRPSCFTLSPSNDVTYTGPATQNESRGNVNQVNSILVNQQSGKRPMEHSFFPSISSYVKKHKFSPNPNDIRQWPQFSMRSSFNHETRDATSGNNSNNSNTGNNSRRIISNTPPYISSQLQSTPISCQMEKKWYTSPEEQVDGRCTLSTNIYSLGVLLFELQGSFDNEKAHAAAMLDLQYRILPPNFLSENPKEAGFCLWLLHPEPSLRPTTREILQSEFINESQKPYEEELSSSIEQADFEAESLLHFLVSMKEKKEKLALKLVEDTRCLEVDIEDIERRRSSRSSLDPTHFVDHDPFDTRENRILHKVPFCSEMISLPSPSSSNDSRLIKNMDHLESAYFSMRSTIQLPETDAITRPDNDLLKIRESLYVAKDDKGKQKSTDRLGLFFDGLCKYARYSNFVVRGVLRNGESMNSANVISSMSFDRDEEYFATAGVAKKIKIFEFQSLFNDSVDIHYPVIEMPNKSKLTCVCWNNYIKNYMASTDYDGIVKLWDVNTGQAISHYLAHQKRAWSVDFSQFDPTKLVSGSDDCSVKLWSINEKNCLGVIRKSANVCCVQFSAQSHHLLGFGSSDYKIYCYDLRNAKSPWCTLVGHDKAVSYVRFLDSETLVSASTDNTLKLWDLNKTSSSGPSTNACSLTLSGHTNEKNFVGLSVAGEYISCGSETNEVYAYHKSMPMPVTYLKFSTIDPVSGKETDDDDGHFVSSVCWKGKSDMVVAANSTGCIKVLQMV